MTQKKYAQVTPKIAPQLADWYREHYKTLNAGATTALKYYQELCIPWVLANFSSFEHGLPYLIESYKTLHRRTLGELKGRFTRGELCLLIDVFNGTMLTPQFLGLETVSK